MQVTSESKVQTVPASDKPLMSTDVDLLSAFLLDTEEMEMDHMHAHFG